MVLHLWRWTRHFTLLEEQGRGREVWNLWQEVHAYAGKRSTNLHHLFCEKIIFIVKKETIKPGVS
jgi:hypothetical protein